MNTETDATLSASDGLDARSSSAPNRLSTNPTRKSEPVGSKIPKVAILTGGGDKPYALGIAAALTSAGLCLDFIGSDELLNPELLSNSKVTFLNLRGDQRPQASPSTKLLRVLVYYRRLLLYALRARPKIFHILWNNKFHFFDRTLLMLYYRMLGKKLTLTVHNVNIGKRDSNDSWLNRISLKIQYRLCHHIFAHTERMKSELVSEFSLPPGKIKVIPFGINNTVPNTPLTTADAKRRLGIDATDQTLLFFGNIAPYKGLEYLVNALIELLRESHNYRLIIAGRAKGSDEYWHQIQETIERANIGDRVIARIEFIPDEQTEIYFKAADLLVLPYTQVFQSGVLSLGYSFGLPVIAADVGSLKEDILEGETGFVCPSRDSIALAKTIRTYFDSALFATLESRRSEIKAYANERYSWSKVASIMSDAYSGLVHD